jgi:hypothetical protein
MHPDAPGNLDDIDTTEHRTNRIQTLLDNRTRQPAPTPAPRVPGRPAETSSDPEWKNRTTVADQPAEECHA